MSYEQRINESLVRVCSSIFGDGAVVRDLSRSTTGWETDIYSFTLLHGPAREQSEQLILRLYSGKDAPEKAEREYTIMRTLHAVGYSVPHVKTLQTSSEPLGTPFLLMERIDGPVLLDAMSQASESRRWELLTLFCETLARLHALDWHIVPPIFAPWATSESTPNAPYAFIDAELATFRRALERFPATQPLTPILRWLESHRDEVPCARFAITHGDYHPYNVLLRPDGLPAVIDWGAAAIADPRRDLAWTLLLTHTPGYAELYEPILRGYESAAGRAVEQLGYFEVIAACRRIFDVLVSLRSGAEALGMRSGAEALMRGQAAHYRKVYALLQDRTQGVTISEIETLLDELD